MRRYHFAGRFSQVRHADAGRKGGVRLCQPLDGHPQPPLLFCDTLPDCSVIIRLSSNYSPLSVAHFYAFAIPLGKYPIYSHIPMSRRPRAGSSILFGHVLFDLPAPAPWFGPAYAFLLYSGIPYSSVIYLCAKYFLPGLLLQLLPGYLHVDNSGGVYAKSSMGPTGGSLSLPAGASLPPTFHYRTSCFLSGVQ
jgi:hypothetical protein